MKLPGGGYAPKGDGTKPGTPPIEPAGASSANAGPAPASTCACGSPCDHTPNQED
jgi:hypothetical protein